MGKDNETQGILRALNDNVISCPTDENIILNNGQIYRANNRIVEIIGTINETDSIQCYEWFQLDTPKHRFIRPIYHNLATIIISYSQLASTPLSRISSVPFSISAIPLVSVLEELLPSRAVVLHHLVIL